MTIPRPLSEQPLPPDAQRVFHGVIFDVYQWQQPMFDGGTKVFEKLVRPDTVTIIPITDDGQILYAYEEQPGTRPCITSIGGRVDEGEDVLTAAKRELLEESGYVSDEWVLFDAYQPAPKIEWAIYVFIARHCRKQDDQTLDSGERIEVRRVTFEEYLTIITDPTFLETRLKEMAFQAKLDSEQMTVFRKQLLG